MMFPWVGLACRNVSLQLVLGPSPEPHHNCYNTCRKSGEDGRGEKSHVALQIKTKKRLGETRGWTY